MKEQPAEKSYVFDKAYRDVKHTFDVTWGDTFDSAKIKKLFSNVFLFIPNLLVFLIITAFRVVLNSIISLLLIAVFLSVAPIVYIGFVTVAFIDYCYRFFGKISNVCPYCQYKFDLPTYLCPTCGIKHTRLIPSKYGILKRKCLCGTKLPTTFFNGRQKLEGICPKCDCSLKDKETGGEQIEVCIPVIGGSSAGKTCFINMAILQLEQGVASRLGYNFKYVPNGLNEYTDIVRGMKRGCLPEKTSEMRLKYYQFYLTYKGSRLKKLVSICDVGGEIYQDQSLIGNQIGFRYADGFIIVVDPLSIIKYRSELQGKVDISTYGMSTEVIDDILSRLIITLENLHAASSKTKFKTRVAIVFTKCDIPGLDEQIGEKAVDLYVGDHNVSREQASNILCEDFLQRYDESNFVNIIKSKFNTVQYFTCSSLGNQDGKKFKSTGVEAPIIWLLKNI